MFLRRIPLYTIFLLFSSCKQNAEQEKLLHQLSQNLKSNNEQIENSISHIRSAIKSRAREPQGIPCMIKMDSLATMVSSLTDSLIHLAEKEQIDMNVTAGAELSLKQLEDVDTELRKEFKKQIDSIWIQFQDVKITQNDQYTKLKKSLLANHILQLKNTMLLYLNSKCTGCSLVYEGISALVGQNTTTLKKGDELKITAGIGRFETILKPSFKINNKWYYPEYYYPFEYKMKVQQEPGKYKMPVEIKFIDFSGIEQIRTELVEYTVVE